MSTDSVSPVEPEAVLDKIKGVAGNVMHTLTSKREPGVLPLPVQEKIAELEKAGVDTVTTLQLIRKPMDEYVKELLQGISLGAYKDAVKDSPYDEMFHLSLLINGKYRLEKNEVIALSDAPRKLPSGAQFMRVVIPKDSTMTIRSMLLKTKECMGNEDFTNYHARTNNCQNFCMGLLKGNGLGTDLLRDFTYQDAEAIFEQMPEYTTAVAVAMTDAAAIADKLIKDHPKDCQALIAEFAQNSREAIAQAKQGERYRAFVEKAKDLHNTYGDRIPEDRLRDAMKEMRIAIPEAPDVVLMRMSITDKVSQIFGMLGKPKQQGSQKGALRASLTETK